MVSHVGSLGRNVLGIEGAGESLLSHEGNVAKGGDGGNDGSDDGDRAGLAQLGDDGRGAGALHVISPAIEMRSGASGRGFVPDFDHGGGGELN